MIDDAQNSDDCPSEEVLEQLLRSSLEDPQEIRLAEHVETCKRCQSALDRLTSLPDQWSSLGTDVDTTDAALATMMSRLRDMHPVMPSAQDNTLPDVQTARSIAAEIDDFDRVEYLGSGGSGVLFRALHKRLGRDVAIKIWDAGSLSDERQHQRVDREAQGLARLDHPYIVRVFDFGSTTNGAAYLVMEYVAGRPLSAILRQFGALAPRRSARLTRDVALALAAAHDLGLVHRDVKPANILLLDPTEATAGELSDRIKLVDFGLVLDRQSESLITREGSFVGTPYYMSPEQIANPHEVDSRSDVYSLGVVLYELLTGTRPFQGVLRMVLLQALHEQPVEPRKLDDSIPVDLETICLKAMAKEPSRRYSTCGAMADDLQRWLDHRPITARRPSSLTRLVSWARRNPQTAALVCGLAILFSVLGIGGPLASMRIARARDLAKTLGAQVATQRNQALDTLRTMVFEVPDHMSNDEIDLDQIERAVLEAALVGLESSSFTDGDAETQTNTLLEVAETAAIAHARLAGTLYWSDQLAEAKQHANAAIALAQQWDTSKSHSPLFLEAKSLAHWFLGLLASDENDERVAESEFQKSMQSDRQRLECDEDQDGVIHDMLATLPVVIDLVSARKDFAQAGDLIDEAFVLITRMQHSEAFRCEGHHSAEIDLLRAELMYAQSDPDEARQWALAGIEKFDGCVGTPSCMNSASNCAAMYRLLADISLDEGDEDDAQAWIEKGNAKLELFRTHYDDHPAIEDWMEEAHELLEE